MYIGPVGDLGWTYAHDQGRMAMEENLPGIATSYLENVPEVQADAERAIRSFAEEGNNLIIATSFGYGPAVLAVAPQFPDIQFIHISGYQVAENVSTGFGKIEEPRYVSGFVAGKMAATGKLGYVAAFPIPEVIRGINAFTLGVRAATRKRPCRWSGPTPGTTRRSRARPRRPCSMAAPRSSPSTRTPPGPQQAAEAAGKYGVGYNVDMSELAPAAVLTSPMWNWGPYYTWAAQEILAGTWTSNQYWGSWADGVVDLAPIAGFVPEDVRAEAEALAEQFRSGEMGVTDIFTGPILNQDGVRGCGRRRQPLRRRDSQHELVCRGRRGLRRRIALALM